MSIKTISFLVEFRTEFFPKTSRHWVIIFDQCPIARQTYRQSASHDVRRVSAVVRGLRTGLDVV
jgi:hypothetical protein